ncbi:hypothetical protein [Sphingomicrobium lutaoense]|uniref:Uncharacterized protein n=1 Tax=Sphingomicrobium lutaoense TaxID=515949 RepID=A0A839YUI3_9SPHN|nr:hypothetical protein [Sphingomicrobium lutaoense]MBB3763901.1 hypothetical protein [Sphingomicrobium lutaoense]
MKHSLSIIAAACLVVAPAAAHASGKTGADGKRPTSAWTSKERVSLAVTSPVSEKAKVKRWVKPERSVDDSNQRCSMPPLMRLGNAVAAFMGWMAV